MSRPTAMCEKPTAMSMGSSGMPQVSITVTSRWRSRARVASSVTMPVRMMASARRASAASMSCGMRALSAPVRPSITTLPSSESSALIASMVSLKMDCATSGTSTATRRLRLEASPPAMRLGT